MTMTNKWRKLYLFVDLCCLFDVYRVYPDCWRDSGIPSVYVIRNNTTPPFFIHKFLYFISICQHLSLCWTGRLFILIPNSLYLLLSFLKCLRLLLQVLSTLQQSLYFTIINPQTQVSRSRQNVVAIIVLLQPLLQSGSAIAPNRSFA